VFWRQLFVILCLLSIILSPVSMTSDYIFVSSNVSLNMYLNIASILSSSVWKLTFNVLLLSEYLKFYFRSKFNNKICSLHEIAEILLKLAFNTNQSSWIYRYKYNYSFDYHIHVKTRQPLTNRGENTTILSYIWSREQTF
jgi:hypothetical protein